MIALLLLSLPADCQQFGNAELLGRAAVPGLVEASGLASAADGEYLWSHNDSGGDATLFAMGFDGKAAGRLDVLNAEAVDWEDLAAGPCAAQRCLYIGDIGDNAQRREHAVIYRVVEPPVPGAETSVSATAERLIVRYPMGPRDAEGLAVDPINGDLLIVTKRRDQASSELLLVPFEAWTSEAVTAAVIAEIPWSGEGLATAATAAAFAPSGASLYVQTYSQAQLLTVKRQDGRVAGLEDSRPAPVWGLGQCEAATFAIDGRSLWFTCEGNDAPIAKADCFDAPADPEPPEPPASAEGCGGCGDSSLVALVMLPLAQTRKGRTLRSRG